MDTRTVGNATIVALPPRIDANTAAGVQELAALIAKDARAIVGRLMDTEETVASPVVAQAVDSLTPDIEDVADDGPVC